ncbi:MAG: UDP-N-acetylglucosamine pyrophosphorylase [Bacillota bacterium]|nr:UDP-N-acetylglucosamine pyrophosphorylase [Bacillota bacterium]
MYENLHTEVLLDLERTIAKPLFENTVYPWEALCNLQEFIIELGNSLNPEKYEKHGENIWIEKTAKVAETASLTGPLIICRAAEIRHCAFIRGNVIVGRHAVVGNSTELKSSVLFDYVQVPHYNYVGDSILGFKAHMGAGSITSNLKSDKSPVDISIKGAKVASGLKKLGAIVGDYVEVGCNSVLNPGTVVGRKTSIYPLSMVRGFVPDDSIFKDINTIVKKK